MEEEDKDQIIIGSSTPIDATKFVIKLKIPNMENDSIESSKMSKEAKRVCPVCNKEFSSGKALGGHMRIHSQSFDNTNPNFLQIKKYKKHHHLDDMSKKMVNKNKNKNKKPYYLSSVNSEGKPTCSQCGKSFPSMKSLFGHMRCHPERIWRGILPPPNIAINPNHSFVGSSSSSVNTNQEDNINDGGDDVIDLSKFLRGWGATERRGRPSLKSDTDEDEDEDGVLLEAVEDLMSLSQGQLKIELNDHHNCNDQYSDSDSGINKINKRKKMKLMMDLEPELSPNAVSIKEDDDFKYKCTTCNRCFSSHQALGGHRSSHNKVRMITSPSVDDNHEGEFERFEFAGVHQCKICDKVFATGQALGGHKRCHWVGINEPQQVQVQVITTDQVDHPSSQITSIGEDDSGNGKKVLDFDLNEIPVSVIEEDEAEIGIGIGYASSSYNSNMCYS